MTDVEFARINHEQAKRHLRRLDQEMEVRRSNRLTQARVRAFERCQTTLAILEAFERQCAAAGVIERAE